MTKFRFILETTSGKRNSVFRIMDSWVVVQKKKQVSKLYSLYRIIVLAHIPVHVYIQKTMQPGNFIHHNVANYRLFPINYPRWLRRLNQASVKTIKQFLVSYYKSYCRHTYVPENSEGSIQRKLLSMYACLLVRALSKSAVIIKYDVKSIC